MNTPLITTPASVPFTQEKKDPQATLQSWIEEEAAIMKVVLAGVGIGVATPEMLAGLTGLQIMQQMMEGHVFIAPIAQTLSFISIAIQEGQTVFQATPKPEHFNPMGTIHGGWMATVMDSAMGSAVLSTLPRDHAYTTSDLSLKYVKRLGVDVGRVRVIATAPLVEPGARIKSALASSQMVGPDGTIYATATTQCRVFRTA